jgi:hypothetical protein
MKARPRNKETTNTVTMPLSQNEDSKSTSIASLKEEINSLKESSQIKNEQLLSQEQMIQRLSVTIDGIEQRIDNKSTGGIQHRKTSKTANEKNQGGETSSSSSSSTTETTADIFHDHNDKEHATDETKNQSKSKSNKKINTTSSSSFSKDTFTLMMFHSVLTKCWLFGFFIFLCQTTLLFTILHDLLNLGRFSAPFDVPFWVDGNFVRVGQFVCFIVVLLTQRDVGEAISYIITFRKQDSISWDVESGKHDLSGIFVMEHKYDFNNKWVFQLLIPNLFKLIIGFASLLACFIVIIKSNEVLDMFIKLVALLIIAEMDRIAFNITESGSLGSQMKRGVLHVKQIKLNDIVGVVETNIMLWKNIFTGISTILIFGGWIGIMRGQDSGSYFRAKYPNCNIDVHDIKMAGDGTCDGFLNVITCDFDMGDCVNFNLGYPDCKVPQPFLLGNGQCDGMVYNSKECNYDGMDCYIDGYPDCFVEDPKRVG